MAITSLYPMFAQLTSTNLPIAIVTFSGTPSDTAQIQGNLKIIDNVSGVNTPTDAPKFDGMIGVRLRGNTTYPKKSYSIETWSATSVSLDTSLLGMPSENDWVLLSSYEDRSLARFMLSTKTVQKMGRYAPRMKYCELIVNSQYQGIYLLGEKIKRDSNRVDISKLTNIDVSGNNLTGGYILNVDGGSNGWTSPYAPPFGTTQTIKVQIEYPDPSDILPVQENYIEAYVDSFENAMNAANFQDTTLGWRRFGGVNSMADYMIITEVCKDLDAYRKNAYFYKDKGNKLRFGPIWGHDVAWKNSADCNAAKDTGWAFNHGAVCATNTRLAPFWWSKVVTDTAYMRELKCAYSLYRMPGGALDTTTLFSVLDSVNTYLNAQSAVSRNFTQWPIWGVPIVNEPTPMASTYSEELANMKAFIKARLAWLDTKWYMSTGCPLPASVQNIMVSQNVRVYPNPASSELTVTIQTASRKACTIRVVNMQGATMFQTNSTTNTSTLNISNLAPGLYFVHIYDGEQMVSKKFVKQ